jgi:hypothetical protein
VCRRGRLPEGTEGEGNKNWLKSAGLGFR